jgi:hypothetical protein
MIYLFFMKKYTGVNHKKQFRKSALLRLTRCTCYVALTRSSALASRPLGRSAAGTLAFADASANVSCTETLAEISITDISKKEETCQI